MNASHILQADGDANSFLKSFYSLRHTDNYLTYRLYLIVTDVSNWRAGFNPKDVHTSFLVSKVTLSQIYFDCFLPVIGL
jgi:hypothetical protein